MGKIKQYFAALRETWAVIRNGQLAASKAREHDEYVDIDEMIRDIDEKGQ